MGLQRAAGRGQEPPGLPHLPGAGGLAAGPVAGAPPQDGGDPDPNHNGQSGDNNTPTVFVLPVSIVQIPTLGTWGLLALAALLGLFAVRRLTRPARI